MLIFTRKVITLIPLILAIVLFLRILGLHQEIQSISWGTVISLAEVFGSIFVLTFSLTLFGVELVFERYGVGTVKYFFGTWFWIYLSIFLTITIFPVMLVGTLSSSPIEGLRKLIPIMSLEEILRCAFILYFLLSALLLSSLSLYFYKVKELLSPAKLVEKNKGRYPNWN